MVWGVYEGECIPEILNPLGLVSYGGGTNPKNGKMTYRVCSINKTDGFEYVIDTDKIDEIGRIYQNYLRIKKLKAINRALRSTRKCF